MLALLLSCNLPCSLSHTHTHRRLGRDQGIFNNRESRVQHHFHSWSRAQLHCCRVFLFKTHPTFVLYSCELTLEILNSRSGVQLYCSGLEKNSQKSALCLIYRIQWLQSWLLRFFCQRPQQILGQALPPIWTFFGHCQVCCSVVQCVAVRCSVLHCVAATCSMSQKIPRPSSFTK